MDRVSDEVLYNLIAVAVVAHAIDPTEHTMHQVMALTELRDRRQADTDYRKALDAAHIEFLRGHADINAGGEND